MAKANKYEIGEKDRYGNRNFDWRKVFADLKKVVLGKTGLSNDLYEVMYLRFTIAHYDRTGWMHYYDGNWAKLANEIRPHAYGDFPAPDSEPFDDICKFLRFNDKKEVMI